MAARSFRIHFLRVAVLYLGVAVVLVSPALLATSAVPGAPRTDLANSLWSLWFFATELASGELPGHTLLLDHPEGGTLWVADPVGGLLAAPLVWALGVLPAYTSLVIMQVALSGVMAHLFAEDLHRAHISDEPGWTGLIAGVGYATAPILLAGVHNGTSEAFAGGWAAWAAWACWRVAHRASWRGVPEAAAALCLAALASWYGAVVAFLFAGFIGVLGVGEGWRRGLAPRMAAVILGLALVAPVAVVVHEAAVAQDNLVGIKHDREVRTVRRTTGPADPVGYFAPGDFRSPDFRELSRYAEGFFHCHYLGFVLLTGALLALRRRRGTGALWAAGLVAAALSMGPVLARFGQAVIVMGDRAIPLPYLLLEGLPGFGSLSLLYRLAQGPALAVSLLAALGFGGLALGARRGVVGVVVVAVLLEGALLSPLGLFPDKADMTVSPGIRALAAAEPGAVMNYPIAGGRDYLYEQTVHGMPVTGTLNFPNNLTSKKVWKTMLDHVDDPPAEFRAEVGRRARKQGVRYLVVHIDPHARPDMHDNAVRAVREAFDPIGGTEGVGSGASASETSVRVYDLW